MSYSQYESLSNSSIWRIKNPEAYQRHKRKGTLYNNIKRAEARLERTQKALAAWREELAGMTNK